MPDRFSEKPRKVFLRNILSCLGLTIILIILLYLAKLSNTVPEEIKDKKDLSYFARVPAAGIELAYPAAGKSIAVFGFHEAGTAKALALLPVKKVLTDDADTVKSAFKSMVKPVYLLMGTRKRGKIPTTAVDIAIPAGETVLAPVDGKILKIKDYMMYKKYKDYYLEIEPEKAPGFKIKIMHIKEILVKEGEKIKTGQKIARPADFKDKMRLQVNNYIPEKLEHIHIQAERTDSENV